MSEHLVAIVSFEGALKREIKRVRELLRRDETLSSFELVIKVEGRVHDGDIKLSFGIGQWASEVTGANLQNVLDEYMRRRGWQQRNEPLAIGYERIPSDNTEERATASDDEIPF